MNKEKELTEEQENKKTSFEKEIGDTTYEFTQENKGYAPEQINNGKIAFVNKPKTLVRTRNNPFNQNIGLGNKGFTKMLGLGLLLSVFAIIIIFILNRI